MCQDDDETSINAYESIVLGNQNATAPPRQADGN
jgi:hypothetical protein